MVLDNFAPDQFHKRLGEHPSEKREKMAYDLILTAYQGVAQLGVIQKALSDVASLNDKTHTISACRRCYLARKEKLSKAFALYLDDDRAKRPEKIIPAASKEGTGCSGAEYLAVAPF